MPGTAELEQPWMVIDCEVHRRYCSRCRRTWPDSYQNCPECRLWLGEAHQIQHRSRWVPKAVATKGDLAAAVWAELPVSFRGPIVQDASLVSVCTETTGQVLGPASSLHAWLQQLPSVLEADADLLMDAASGITSMAALFIGQDDQVHAERAASAALAARDLADHLRLADGSSGVEVFIGVNTGPLAFERARGERLRPEGGALQLAEALGRSLGPGRIVASPSAYRLLRRSFQAYGTAPLFMDGGLLPPTIYVLGARKPTVSWHDLLSSHRAPLVGRGEELRALQEAWRAAALGDGQVVHLVASPGSGKSKLVDVFAEWLEEHVARRPALFRAWGACYGGYCYQLLADILEQGKDSADEMLRAISGGVGLRHNTTDQVAGAVSGLVRAAGVPTVLLLDDLHWADSSSLAVLTKVLPAWRAAGALVVLSYRPSLADRWAVAADRAGHVLPLKPLSTSSGRRLLGEHGGEALPSPVQGEILEAAAGNPLYIEEAVALAKEVGSDRVAGRIPTDLFGLLLARIDSWSNAQLKVLETEASASFVLQADLNKRVGEVERRIVDWLDRIESGGYFERVEVGILLRRLRGLDLRLRLLRWRIGTSVNVNDRLREAVARLYDAPAGDWSRAIRGYDKESGDHAEALYQAGSAADAAVNRGDHASAIQLYELAINLCDGERCLPGWSRGHLLSRLARSLELSGEIEPALRAYLEAAGAAEEGSRLAITALSRAAVLAARIGSAKVSEVLSSARTAFEAQVKARQGDGPTDVVAEANLALATAYVADASEAERRGAAERALETAERAHCQELAMEAAALLLSREQKDGIPFKQRLARLLGHWQQGAVGPESVPMYLALADTPAPAAAGRPARRILARRYRIRALDLARLLDLSGWQRKLG